MPSDEAAAKVPPARRIEELERELSEAREQQTAASEILRVISRSPSQLGPVFETIVKSTTRLGGATFACLGLFEGDALRFAATSGASAAAEFFSPERLHPPDGCPYVVPLARAKRTAQTPDVRAERGYREGDPFYVISADVGGARTVLRVPLLKDDTLLGHLWAFRQEIHPFADKQVALVQTFADQAVIAIENTRLFEAEQASKRELGEALQYQTAISSILDIISRSKGEIQPVFDAIVQTAARLFYPCTATITTLSDGHLHWNSSASLQPAFDLLRMQQQYPVAFDPERAPSARAILERRTIVIPDAAAPETPEFTRKIQAAGGFRSISFVPLVSQDKGIGSIILTHPQAGFELTTNQIKLLQTFADQAVIAIENTRLFEAEQARTRELSEALEQQTATSEVLQAISNSPGELEPVFEAMLANATRLCGAKFGTLSLYDGDTFRNVAVHNVPPAYADIPLRERFRPHPKAGLAHVARTKQIAHTEDLRTQPPYLEGDLVVVAIADLAGARTILNVPMLKDSRLVGTISIFRQEVRPFSDKQIELVTSFARQAVIAIENVRLLNELRESLEYQTATSEVLNVISRSPTDIQPVLDAVGENAARLCEANNAVIFRLEGDLLRQVASYGGIPTSSHPTQGLPVDRDRVTGRAVFERKTVHVHDLATADSDFPEGSKDARRDGHRTTLATPLLREGVPLGAILIRRMEVRPFSDQQIKLLETFADQAVIAIENTRLFEEIAQKGRELEIASQHKSQFVANMSHELRTPLAAILGYAELMQEGFYEPPGKKSLDALTRIRSNGKHLLGLINTVLDIAKIESGQFSLNLAEYALSSVVETVRAATESLAETKKIALMTHVPKSLPIGFGDEQRLTQVLLNLVGNAIKFTDTGEVRITAKAENGHFAVSVADTGPGIPADQLTRVFDQFHQVDNSNTKRKGGTGLGLAIAKQIVEMHGGRVWVESEPGEGATFLMQLPVRAESRNALQ
jgi:signal transduction histidine kinase